MTEAVIFDFDGVLADTERLHLRAFQSAFRAHGWALDDDTYFSRYLGYDDGDLVDAFARDHGLSIGAADRRAFLSGKSGAYHALVGSGAVLYSGAQACVDRLGRRFPLAIASGSHHAEIVDILAAGGLLHAFRVIVGADEVAQSKPAPDLYLAAAARLGVAPSRCVAIEDSHWGLDAARAAGLRTIAITTTSPASALGAASRIIQSLDELTAAFVESLGPDT